jgi:hypothetical protein
MCLTAPQVSLAASCDARCVLCTVTAACVGRRWFFQQLVLAVDYCHRKGVARDIKLENTLLAVSMALMQAPSRRVANGACSRVRSGRTSTHHTHTADCRPHLPALCHRAT